MSISCSWIAPWPTPTRLPVPAGSGLADLIPPPHTSVEVDVPDVAALLAAQSLAVTTMGRDVTQDPLFFDAVAAAAAHAVNLLTSGDTVATS